MIGLGANPAGADDSGSGITRARYVTPSSLWHTGGMSDLETMPAQVIPDVDEDVQTEEPAVAHIVKVGPGESAVAKVLEARINGTPIEALCGHVWVPARDPKQLPVCQACKETYDMYRIFNDGLRDSPND